MSGVVNVVVVNVRGGECQGLKFFCKNKQHIYFQKINHDKNGQGATKPKHKSERCIMNAYIHLLQFFHSSVRSSTFGSTVRILLKLENTFPKSTNFANTQENVLSFTSYFHPC